MNKTQSTSFDHISKGHISNLHLVIKGIRVKKKKANDTAIFIHEMRWDES